MRQVQAQYSSQEVAAYAGSSLDSDTSISNWIADTGLRVPVITDNSSDLSCWEMPEGVMSLYHHFFERTGGSGPEGPFPLHLVVAPDGTLAYISREHHPDQVLEVLDSLVE